MIVKKKIVNGCDGCVDFAYDIDVEGDGRIADSYNKFLFR